MSTSDPNQPSSYGKIRDTEWIQEAIDDFGDLAACVTEVLQNNLKLGSLPQGRYTPLIEIATSVIVTSLVMGVGIDKYELIQNEIWPRYAAITYNLYGQALIESKEISDGTDT